MGVISSLANVSGAAVNGVVSLVSLPIGLAVGLVKLPIDFVLRSVGFYRLVRMFAAKVIRQSDKFFVGNAHPLLRGDLVAYAEAEYPPSKYPTAWVEPPKDIRRPFVWDGRLLNGRRVAELAKAKITDEIVGEALYKSGVAAAAFAVMVSLMPFFWNLFRYGSFGVFDNLTPYPEWAGEAGAVMPIVAWYVLTVIEHVYAVLRNAAMPGLLLTLFPIFWFFAFMGTMSRVWRQVSNHLRVPTRDSEVFWKSNVLTREMQYKAYCREVEQAMTRLADQPLIPVGEATGTVRGRGDNEAPVKGQIVGYDGESIRQHTLILGGTGSGKTRLAIRPLFRRIMTADWGRGHKIGAYITDGKGTLWRDLAPMVADRQDVAILGTDKDMFGLDLVQGMSPLEVATTFKAIARQVSGEGTDDFWPESASLLLMHSATVARALELSGSATEAFVKEHRFRPYSLLGISLLATEEPPMRQAMETVGGFGDDVIDGFGEDEFEIVMDASASINWLDNSFLKLGDNTKGSIIANVYSVLGKLQGARELSRRFCSGIYPDSVDVDHALKGGVLLVAVGENEHGMAGKIVTTWLKSRLYILARRRLLTDPDGCRNTSCALFADEFQMLATTGPDSDSTFWNIARETGVFMVAATQSLAALRQAVGDDATANLVNLLRSKIILKTEEESTIRYAIELSGQIARGWEYHEDFYATQTVRERDEHILRPVVQASMASCVFPSEFSASTAPYDVYSANHISNIWEAPSVQGGLIGEPTGDGGYSSMRQQMMMREEDKQQDAMVGNLQMRPKIDTDEMLLGSGLAFAIIQRAGGDRMDIIDLDIAA